MKKSKLTINIAEWKDGKLDIKDIIADSLDEALGFITTLTGFDLKVWI